MFIKILPHCGTKEEFFEQNLSLQLTLFVGEAQHPDLSHLAEIRDPIFKEISKWLRSLLTSLDFYIWIFANQIIPQSKNGELLQQSALLRTLSYFLKSIAGKDITEVIKSINEALLDTSRDTKIFHRNLENIDTIRCMILVRIVDLLTILVKENVSQFLNENKAELMQVVKKLIFKPHRLGFDYKSKDSVLQLPARLTKFVASIREHAPVEFRREMSDLLRTKLMKHFNGLSRDCEQLLPMRSVSVLEVNKLNGIELVAVKMKDFLELDQKAISKTAGELLKKLFDGTAEVKAGIHRPRHLAPSTKTFATSVMRLCLKVDAFLPKVIAFSFNDEVLKISESCSVRHGEHFMQTFRNPIFELFTATVAETIRLLVTGMESKNALRIMAILTELNEFILKCCTTNEQLLQENVDALIEHWPKIIRVVSEMENNLNCVDLAIINLVTFMAMTCPIEWHVLGQRLEKFQAWLYALLEKRDNSLEIKSKAVFLLPCVTSRDDKTNEQLMKALGSVQQKHLPLKSDEFPDGGLERAGLVAITNALFRALLTSRSPVLYRFIINATISDENYLLETKLQQVQVDLMQSLSGPEQEVILNQTFDAFLTGGFGPEVRLNFVTRFLLTIMKNCRVDVMLSFIGQKLTTIWSLLDASLSFEAEQAFVSRCGACMMIEAFVASVPKETIERESFSLAGKVSTGENLIKVLIKKLMEVRTDVTFVVDDPVRQELFRKFHCFSYRALSTIVSNTKDNPQLYNLALFKEGPKTGHIWRNVVDVKNENLYANWSQDFESMPRVKEYAVSVKDLATNAAAGADRKYIDNVSIFDRSLSQSLTKTDLTYSVVFSNREALQRFELDRQPAMKVRLESTPINDHEVMPVLVGVINHMHQSKISPFTSLESVDPKKFEWVLSLAAPLGNRDNHKNVRIFLAKLVDNCRHVFVHYAKQMLGPVLSVLADGCIGDRMNFFITDLVTMLLSWNKIYQPTERSEKDDACALLRFLMENAHNEREEIFKLNLELIKKLVETWSDVLAEKIPTQTLLDLLQKPMEQEMNQKLRCGIQLNAVILANDLVPWKDNEQRNLFVKAIVGCFNNSNAQVYRGAAQLLGMCLQKINDVGECDELVDEITQRLERIRKKFGNDVNVFLQLLYGIQKGFPRILDHFMTLIKFNIPKAVRAIKCIYLEMYLARLEIDGENVFREIISIGTRNLLKQNEYQLLALHIVNKALEHLTSEAIGQLMDDLSLLASSPREEVRRILYEMLIFIAEKFRDDPTFDRKKTMRIILKGFTDVDQQVQNRVANFFSIDGELPKSFAGRFQELLQHYCDPSLEKEFLHYATQLLLDIPIRHPRSSNKLLDYDTTKDRNFFEYPIATKSSSQRSIPPMFIQSQQKHLLAGDGSVYDQLIRATQLSDDNQMFSHTQDPVKMTQVPPTFNFQQTQNSLFFSLKPQFLDRRSKICSLPDMDENDIETQIARKKEAAKPDSLDYLRQRIVRRDEQGRSKEFALRAVERRDFQEAKQAENLRESREGKKVVLYRRYRLGDMPDFFFPSLAILLPLQALAKRDEPIARDIFISIFRSIVGFVGDEEFFTSVNRSITKILQQTRNSDSFLMETLIEMAMKSGKFLDISPDALGASKDLMITSALFLESQLIHLLAGEVEQGERGEEPNRKRQRMDQNEVKLKHWLKLSELNYKMDEHEVLVGIFTEKLNLVPAIRDQLTTAIDQELNGNFVDANNIYQQLIRGHAHRNHNEKEFYYQSYFNCLAKLSDWRKITHEIRTQFDSYGEVWDEAVAFNKETLLPHLIKSELRMILNENIDDEFMRILEDWISDDVKCEYLREKFPEEITMLHILDTKYAEGCVEAEKALRSCCDDWSCLEMLDEKLDCLSGARNLAELTNFLHLMTSSPPTMEKRLAKLYQSWKLSLPQPSDSLVAWGDLIAYRENFLKLIDEEKQNDASRHLIAIRQNLLDVAFAQKNCDAARFMINGLKDDLRVDPSDEKFIKCHLAIGKYNMMIAGQKSSPDEQMVKLCNGLKKITSGVIKKEASKDLPEVMIESLCTASEISWNLWKIFEKCQANGVEVPVEYQQSILELIDPMDDYNSEVTDHLLRYSENSLKSARKWAQKFLDGGNSPTVLASTYLKMGEFYHQVYGSGTVSVSWGSELKLEDFLCFDF